MSLVFLHIFRAEALATSVLYYIFQDIRIISSLGRERWGFPSGQRAGWLKVQSKKENVSLQGKDQAGLAHITKESGSLSLAFLSFFFLTNIYWSMVDSQCCARFCCTAK